jgi:UDP-glucose 4-epimerase
MSLKQQFVESFVKNIAKTTAVVFVCGVIGGIWYITDHSVVHMMTEISKVNIIDSITQTEDVEDEVSVDDSEDLESVSEDNKSQFKKIFKKLC